MKTAIVDQPGIIAPLTIQFNFDFSEEEFYNFCRLNDEYRIERNKNGIIHIMSPTGFNTGRFNTYIITELNIWNRKSKTGLIGESSTGYTLPNGAVRSPDASWVSKEKIESLTEDQLEKFPPICPDFVIELRSPSDKLSKLKAKMVEYIENGCRLGWLIDRKEERVFIFRENGTISLVDSFDQKLSGEDVLPGFELDLTFQSDKE